MKKNYVLPFFFLLLAFSGTCQIWSEPEPFIISAHNKTNVFSSSMYGTTIAVWEQSPDSLSTALYFDWPDIAGHEPEILIAEPNVHFKNPVIRMFGQNYDTAMIIYQKVSRNNADIYCIKFTDNGFQSEPVMVSFGGLSNTRFTVSLQSYDHMYLAWNSDGYLLVSNLLENERHFLPQEPDTVFTGEILDTRFRDDYLYWITRDADSSHIMMTFFSYFLNDWKEPFEVFTAKEIGDLSGVNCWHDSMLLAFSYANDDTWHINNFYYASDIQAYYPLEISSHEKYDFSVIPIRDLVDDFQGLYNIAYVDDTPGFSEIFVNQIFKTDEYIRLSYLETTCRNPGFFIGGYEQNGFWVDLLFEAFVDGNWQIYKSETYFSYGAINENQQIAGVSVFPNPATEFIRIQNEHSSQLSIEIFDMNGKRVYDADLNDQDFEIKTVTWKRGVYLVRMANQEGSITRKIVLE